MRSYVGLIGGPLGADASDLETFPFAKNRLVLIVPRGHPLARLRSTGFAAGSNSNSSDSAQIMCFRVMWSSKRI